MKSYYETALSWVVCAKNTSLINNNGFSPAQLVFGSNPNLTNFLEKKFRAQEYCKSIKIVLLLFMQLKKLLFHQNQQAN